MNTRHKHLQEQRDSRMSTSSKKPTRKTSKPNNEIIGKDNELENVHQTINKLPEEKRELLVEQMMSISYSGPIPHPSDFQQYESVLPGAADRILSMAEKQLEHRQTLEKSVILSDVENSKRGQWFGFIIALVCTIGGFILIALNKDAIGLSVVIGSIATLAGLFIYGQKSDARERKEKEMEDRNNKDLDQSS